MVPKRKNVVCTCTALFTLLGGLSICACTGKGSFAWKAGRLFKENARQTSSFRQQLSGAKNNTLKGHLVPAATSQLFAFAHWRCSASASGDEKKGLFDVEAARCGFEHIRKKKKKKLYTYIYIVV